MLGLLGRVLSDCSMDAKSEAYNSLVRPQLEYACSVWNPCTKRNIHQIKLVQHRAARFAFRDFSNFTHVTSMLKQFDWDTLEQRRLSHQLSIFYKIQLRIGSCLTCVYRVMDALGKFGEHERSVRVARGAAESNSSFLSALQTSQVHP